MEKRTGRPKGSFGRKMQVIRAAAQNALKPGKTPLDIMIRNMLHYDEKADELMAEIIKALHFSKKKPDAMELLDKLKALNDMRMQAQKCAVDAAPFVHPKLSNIEMKVDSAPVERPADESAMTEEQLVEYYNKLRTRPTSIKPMEVVTLDNETGEQVLEDEE
jgi:hypothetical protein